MNIAFTFIGRQQTQPRANESWMTKITTVAPTSYGVLFHSLLQWFLESVKIPPG
jgi:hypothetical protein